MELRDSRHGTPAGYKAGCRGSTIGGCPQWPLACQTVQAEAQAARRAMRAATADTAPTEGALSYHVKRRLNETIAAAGMGATLARLAMSYPELEALIATQGTYISYDTSERIDQAWSYLVRGSDTLSPDFVHGRGRTSYTRHSCRCRVCTVTHQKISGEARAGLVGPTSRLTGPDVEKVRRHAVRLAAVGGAQHAARVCGIPSSSFHSIIKGTDRGIQMSAVAKILATTVADVGAADQALVPSAAAYHRIRTLEALGYPMKWQALESGVGASTVSRIAPDGTVTTRFDQAIAALEKKYGSQVAGPAQGISEQRSAQSQRRAHSHGFYPPAAYDEERNLVPRALPEHPWSKLDDRAATAVMGCYYGGFGLGIQATARRVGVSKTMIEKDSGRFWGYSYLAAAPNGGRGAKGATTQFDHTASRPRIREVAAIHSDWEDGLIGPVTAALMLGFKISRPDHGVGGDHPELVAWRTAERAS